MRKCALGIQFEQCDTFLYKPTGHAEGVTPLYDCLYPAEERGLILYYPFKPTSHAEGEGVVQYLGPVRGGEDSVVQVHLLHQPRPNLKRIKGIVLTSSSAPPARTKSEQS